MNLRGAGRIFEKGGVESFYFCVFEIVGHFRTTVYQYLPRHGIRARRAHAVDESAGDRNRDRGIGIGVGGSGEGSEEKYTCVCSLQILVVCLVDCSAGGWVACKIPPRFD